jgi:hypothetical protein
LQRAVASIEGAFQAKAAATGMLEILPTRLQSDAALSALRLAVTVIVKRRLLPNRRQPSSP